METTYWLARVADGTTEGPFESAQLQAMYNNGSITAQSMICATDSNEWMPVAAIIRAQSTVTPAAAEEPAGTGGRSFTTLIAIMVLLIGGVFAWTVATHKKITFSGFLPKIETEAETSAKAWVKENLSDSNAEVTKLGPLVHMEDKYYRKIKVREPGAVGGPVVNDYIATVAREGHVFSAERADVFIQRMTAKYGATQLVEIARALSE